ncbi:MAG: 3-hydroxyacyl-CoA dehydrogenase family protein [Dehalococcoidia bacterium]|nr:3-hydroxyacyl-CoA dehydrogenase family protein [Dehalococcoidia bacterium]
MKLADVHSISVVGAGIMGHGIGQVFAMAGYDVCLTDVNADILQQALVRIRKNLDIFRDNGFITGKQSDAAMARVRTEVDLGKAVRNADVVVEAIKEDIELKRTMFNKLDALCPPRTVLASNSSSLLISDFASGTKRQDRVVLVHWYNPPHIVPAVEIIRGVKTSDETATLMYDLLKKAKKLPIRINKEMPGYMLNRIQLAVMREVWHLWQEGIASVEDIDLAVKGSLGFRYASIGPLLTSDLGGQDTFAAVAKYLFPQLSDAHVPPEPYLKMVEAGNLGMKTGKGFYEHTKEEWDAIIEKRDREFLQRLKQLYWES